MEIFNIFNWKTGTFFDPQQINNNLTRGDLVTINETKYFVTHSEFPSPLNPMIIVWPAKLSFPSDFMGNYNLFDWLNNYLKGLIIEVSSERGEIIKGKVVELYTDKIYRILPDHSQPAISHNYYPEDYISKVKISQFENGKQPIFIDITLEQCHKIEIKGN